MVGPYVVRRMLQAIPLLFGISIIIFLMLQMAPGGPLASGEAQAAITPEKIERLRAHYGLDDPLPIQYLNWLGGLVTGDWGVSYDTGQPVLQVITERLPTTLALTGLAFAVSLLIAIPVGILAATRQYSVFDYASTGLSFAGIATPSFWFGLMLLYLFSFQWDLLPSAGLTDLREDHVGFAAVWDRTTHLIMPVAVLALIATANLARYVRASMLEVLGQDYVRTARGSGLPERTVILQHAGKNASVPVVTIAMLMVPELFLGAVITETIFSIPGMGALFVHSAELRDYPVLLGILVIAAVLVVITNLAADVIYGFLDPRISYE